MPTGSQATTRPSLRSQRSPTRRPITLRSRVPSSSRCSGSRSRSSKPATRSLYGLPLRTQAGRPTGSMTLLLPDDRPVSGAEESLLVAHAEHASRALDRARRHEREHDVAIALQRSLLPDALPAIEGLDFAGPLQRRRRRARGRRRLVRRRAAAGRDPPPHRRRRRRARHPGRRADGAAAERLSRARLRPHLTRRDRPPADPPRPDSTGWRPPSSSRSIRTRARSPTPRPAIRRRCSSTSRPTPSRASIRRMRRRSAGPRRTRSGRRASRCRRTAPCSPTRTGSSSGAASSIDDGIDRARRAAPRRVGAPGGRGCRPAARLPRHPALGHGRHRAAARAPHRRAVARGDRDPRRPDAHARRASSPQDVARAARVRRGAADRRRARRLGGVQQRDRARLRRADRDDQAAVRAPRGPADVHDRGRGGLARRRSPTRPAAAGR